MADSSSGEPGTSSSTGEPDTSSSSTTGSADESSSSSGVAAVCGDGTQEGSEACDDGNEDDGDGCSADCQTATCLVPVTHDTVQAGVDDEACPTVFVSPGTYVENVDVQRDVVIEAPFSEVTLDGNSAGSVVSIGNAQVTLRNMTITNGLTNQGAGVLSFGDLTLENCVVTENQATGEDIFGAGIAATGFLNLIGTQVTQNSLGGAAPTVAEGGGIYFENGELSISEGSAVSSNTISVSGVPEPTGRGGGLYIANATAFILNSSVSSNAVTMTSDGQAAFALGGGLYADQNSTVLIETVSLAGNTVTASGGAQNRALGGAVYVDQTSIEILNGCSLDANTATATGGIAAAAGGAVFADVQNIDLSIHESSLSGNYVTADAVEGAGTAQGGGVSASLGGSNVQIVACTLAGNIVDASSESASSIADGGAIFLEDGLTAGRAYLSASTLSANTCMSDDTALGGGFTAFASLGTGFSVSVENSTIVDNGVTGTLTSQGGGIMAVGNNADVTVQLANVTLTENSSTVEGGGFSVAAFGDANTLVELRNSIVYGNTGTTGPDCYTDAPAQVASGDYNIFGTLADCTVGGTTPNDQVGADPGLGMLGDNGGLTQTVEISAGMAAENAANPAGCFDYDENGIFVDQRGLARTDCDVGAFEIQ